LHQIGSELIINLKINTVKTSEIIDFMKKSAQFVQLQPRITAAIATYGGKPKRISKKTRKNKSITNRCCKYVKH